MEAIILAGGLGTRLQSRLQGRPKPLALINGRPFLELLMDRLADNGCTRFLLSVGYKSETIIGYYGNRYGRIPIGYIVEDSPLGTGGAIRKALECAVEPHVLVLNGDTFFKEDYRTMLELHCSSGATITVAAVHVEDMSRYGGMQLEEGRVVSFIEKGERRAGWINAGAYVLSRDFPWPEKLPSKFSFETEVLVPLLPRLKHSVFTSYEQ